MHLSVYGNVPLFLTDYRAVSFATVGLTFCKYSSGSIWVVRRFRFIQNSGWVKGWVPRGAQFRNDNYLRQFCIYGAGILCVIYHTHQEGWKRLLNLDICLSVMVGISTFVMQATVIFPRWLGIMELRQLEHAIRGLM